MTRTSNIRTRPDGSIDTAYYMARGRTLRSRQAHDMLGITPRPAKPRKPFLRRLVPAAAR